MALPVLQELREAVVQRTLVLPGEAAAPRMPWTAAEVGDHPVLHPSQEADHQVLHHRPRSGSTA